MEGTSSYFISIMYKLLQKNKRLIVYITGIAILSEIMGDGLTEFSKYQN